MLPLSSIRIVVLVLACTFAGLVIALSAHILVFTMTVVFNDSPFAPPFAVVGIVTGSLTFVTLPVYFLVDVFRKRTTQSMIYVEMITLIVLCALWLTTASLSVAQESSDVINFEQCTFLHEFTRERVACNETKAVEAISFLTFITLLIYTSFLLVFTFNPRSRDHSGIWTASVKNTALSAQYPPNFASKPQTAPPQLRP